jgi:hypothetical protein
MWLIADAQGISPLRPEEKSGLRCEMTVLSDRAVYCVHLIVF